MTLKRLIINLVAIGLFIVVAVTEWREHAKEWEKYVKIWSFCFVGLVMFLCSEEFAQWTGRWGTSHQDFYRQPAWYVKLSGGILFLISAVILLRN